MNLKDVLIKIKEEGKLEKSYDFEEAINYINNLYSLEDVESDIFTFIQYANVGRPRIAIDLDQNELIVNDFDRKVLSESNIKKVITFLLRSLDKDYSSQNTEDIDDVNLHIVIIKDYKELFLTKFTDLEDDTEEDLEEYYDEQVDSDYEEDELTNEDEDTEDDEEDTYEEKSKIGKQKRKTILKYVALLMSYIAVGALSMLFLTPLMNVGLDDEQSKNEYENIVKLMYEYDDFNQLATNNIELLKTLPESVHGKVDVRDTELYTLRYGEFKGFATEVTMHDISRFKNKVVVTFEVDVKVEAPSTRYMEFLLTEEGEIEDITEYVMYEVM